MDEGKIKYHLRQEKFLGRLSVIGILLFVGAYFIDKTYFQNFTLVFSEKTLDILEIGFLYLGELSLGLFALSFFASGILHLKASRNLRILLDNNIIQRRNPLDPPDYTLGILPTPIWAIYSFFTGLIFFALLCGYLYLFRQTFNIYVIWGTITVIYMLILLGTNTNRLLFFHQSFYYPRGRLFGLNIVFDNVLMNVFFRPTILGSTSFLLGLLWFAHRFAI